MKNTSAEKQNNNRPELMTSATIKMNESELIFSRTKWYDNISAFTNYNEIVSHMCVLFSFRMDFSPSKIVLELRLVVAAATVYMGRSQFNILRQIIHTIRSVRIRHVRWSYVNFALVSSHYRWMPMKSSLCRCFCSGFNNSRHSKSNCSLVLCKSTPRTTQA